MEEIVIHHRCKLMQTKARHYRFKVDEQTGYILSVIVHAWKHGWDAVRSSLDGYIQQHSVDSLWAKLAG